MSKGPSQKTKREHIATTSALILDEQIAKLQRLFPETVSEGKVDWDKLRAALGDAVTTTPERFSFSWAGKSEAIQLLQTPTHATLIPCPDEGVDADATGNVFIEGDNLEVLKLLFKPYFGKVKLIYIDPPYNTGQDFVYPDDYADPLNPYLKLTGQMDAEGNLLTSNPETSGRHHSSWLSMMYPRLFLARQLLREDGLIFISIDDHEVHHLRMLMNEIFGEENFVECFVWKRSYGGGAKEKYAVSQHEYVMLFCRDLELLPELWLPPDPEVEKKYYKYEDDKVVTRGPYRLQPLEAGKSMEHRENLIFPIKRPGDGEVKPKRQWLWSKERVEAALAADELVFSEKNGDITVAYKQYLLNEAGEKRGAKPVSVIDGIYTQHGTQELVELFGGQHLFQCPQPTKLMKLLVQTGTAFDQGDLVLDFFSGSCTTAHGVLELNREDGGNRKFIIVQLPEPTENKQYTTIAEIGKERIRRVLAKLKKEAAESLADPTAPKPDLGFKVFKLAAPHIQPWSAEDADREPDRYTAKLAMYNDPLMPGWTAENVLWEIALREGFGLNSRFEKKKLKSRNAVWLVTDPDKDPPQTLLVCLDDKIAVDFSKGIDLAPEQIVVVRDLALDDTAAANLALQCRLKTI
jgi:adenine-specific DNA-methyltransferase